MPKSMLIDASHPEETRVVVVNDRQLEEFDFESSTKRQLKGNIYLAKITRVEPSLQAAFVDYGGGRHGFLAFSEIHPDYFQIPQADRHMLDEASKDDAEAADGGEPSTNGEESETREKDGDEGETESEAVSTDPDEETEEVFAEQAKRRQRLLRNYKIQEVIKRRQIILVQVVKEERGNKGAALTTYLSLAGRYCVLMPNTARGGGISRKIANVKDRTRLKAIAKDLEVPEGMGLIVRTAGQSRNKLEIRRDYEYLLRLWSDIRDRTLDSIAPCTIHEEGALVKRAIRDIYDSDIGEILVEGDEGYKSAKKVMTMLMPSRARRVKQYKEELPLFHEFQIEPQLDALHSPIVELKSGGSIVINPTEALTAIDVNSGRATRERNIEETALRTNAEAAEEIARQLRLRDVAGLVVIDFIDMLEMRNQRTVERRLRDALRFDRARIQLGRISAFGLLELSRQRLRPSFLELSTQPCPVCAGSGTVRSVESAALQALRAVELEGMKADHISISVALPLQVALYLLNQKRDLVVSLEQRYDMKVEVLTDPDLIPGNLKIAAVRGDVEEPEETQQQDARNTKSGGKRRRGSARVQEPVAEDKVENAAEAPLAADENRDEDGDGQRRKRRRRRRRRRSGSDAEGTMAETSSAEGNTATAIEQQDGADGDGGHQATDGQPKDAQPAAEGADGANVVQKAEEDGAEEDAPRSGRRRRRSSTRGRSRRSTSSRGSSRTAEPADAAASAETSDNDREPDEQQTPSAATWDGEAQPPKGETEDRRSHGDAKVDHGTSNGAAVIVDAADDATDVDDAPTKASTPVPTPSSEPIVPSTIAVEPSQLPSMTASAASENGSMATATSTDEEDTVHQASAIMAKSEKTEPRRGWWNRFVRKED